MAESDFRMRLRATRQSAYVLVKVLIQHPMHSGVATDEHGNVPAAHYITRVDLKVNGVTRVQLDTGPGISRDPLFGWRLANVATGSEIAVWWQDNRGFSGSHAVIAA